MPPRFYYFYSRRYGIWYLYLAKLREKWLEGEETVMFSKGLCICIMDARSK